MPSEDYSYYYSFFISRHASKANVFIFNFASSGFLRI